MNIEQVTTRPGRSTAVEIEGITRDRQVSDDVIAGFAMHAAGENPSSLFGWHVTRWTDDEGLTVAATVTLHTD